MCGQCNRRTCVPDQGRGVPVRRSRVPYRREPQCRGRQRGPRRHSRRRRDLRRRATAGLAGRARPGGDPPRARRRPGQAGGAAPRAPDPPEDKGRVGPRPLRSTDAASAVRAAERMLEIAGAVVRGELSSGFGATPKTGFEPSTWRSPSLPGGPEEASAGVSGAPTAAIRRPVVAQPAPDLLATGPPTTAGPRPPTGGGNRGRSGPRRAPATTGEAGRRADRDRCRESGASHGPGG